MANLQIRLTPACVLLIFPLLLAVAQPAQAWLYIEPYGGYVGGSSSQDSELEDLAANPTTSKLNSTTATTGSAYGGKLGLSFGPIAFGGDYMASQMDLFANSKDTVTSLGAFAQLSLIIIKFNGTMFFSSKTIGEQSNASGNGYKAGIGLSFLPLIDLNIDYLSLNYTSASSNKPKGTFKSYSQSTGAVLVTLSIPIAL